MSKIKALITTLVLGSSSIAMADPALSFNAGAHWKVGAKPAPVVARAPIAPAIRDHRTDVSPVPGMYRAAWVALSQPLMLTNEGRNTIRLATPSRYSHLRLQSTAGSSFITSVTVRFANGTRQEFPINKMLSPRDPMISIDVPDRASINRVIVNGSSNRRASFQLFGSPLKARRL